MTTSLLLGGQADHTGLLSRRLAPEYRIILPHMTAPKRESGICSDIFQIQASRFLVPHTLIWPSGAQQVQTQISATLARLPLTFCQCQLAYTADQEVPPVCSKDTKG